MINNSMLLNLHSCSLMLTSWPLHTCMWLVLPLCCAPIASVTLSFRAPFPCEELLPLLWTLGIKILLIFQSPFVYDK